jgi:hypothetical protein
MRRFGTEDRARLSQGKFIIFIVITAVLVAALGLAFGLLGMSRGTGILISIPIIGVLVAFIILYGPEIRRRP